MSWYVNCEFRVTLGDCGDCTLDGGDGDERAVLPEPLRLPAQDRWCDGLRLVDLLTHSELVAAACSATGALSCCTPTC